jgi:dolichol-phosphate mannosyltransferase
MKIVAMIPTYNEAGNIKEVVGELLKLPLDVEALVVDDNSPDGTHKIVDEMSKSDKRVRLLLRKENRGRGWAGIDGFAKALDLGADYIVEMDADLSHQPRYIPSFLEKIKNCDVVVGSRFVSGGKDEQRGFLRHTISLFARKYLASVLGVKLQDPTSGYRLFTRRAIEAILPSLRARDPFIVTEVLFYLKKYNLKIEEVPIEFVQRVAGESKLKPATLIKYLFRVWALKFK